MEYCRHGWRNFFQSGGAQVDFKNYRKFLRFELAYVASQALKYDITTYTLYEGLNQWFSKRRNRLLGAIFRGKRALGRQTNTKGAKTLNHYQ